MNGNRRHNVFSNRYYLIVGLILVLMMILALRLFILTVVQHDKWNKSASNQSTKMIYTSAPRGNIYDRNGQVIASNKQIFSVTFSASSYADDDMEKVNSNILKLMRLLEKNGDDYIDEFPIKIKKDGSMYWTYDQNLKKWLESMDLRENMTAEDALRALRTRYGIPTSDTRYEAIDELAKTYKVSVPISPSTMTYTYDQEKTNFLSKWGCFSDKESSNGVSARKAFDKLCKNYKISSSLSDKDARKILIVRNEMKSTQSYIAATVAKEVSKKTIIKVGENTIPGASIQSQYKRYYPNKNAAAHIIGYMGNISESNSKYYVDKLGYSSSDLIGNAGIEAAYETYLHGNSGVQKILVNSSGQYVRTISKTKPKKGKDVYLTIDLNLQKTAESALASAIGAAGSQCQSGATVAMDTKTGEVLAMASYPSYNPNIFANGITAKAWKSVQSKNTRDSLAPAPLYNNATMASVPPGSTFKPITAVTALQCGLNPNQYITDPMYIQLGGHKWGTAQYNDGGGSYGAENLALGLQHSSNTYFIAIGTGRDWGAKRSLGYKKKITISRIINMSKQFGLGQKTGIELGETVTPSPTKAKKIASYKASLWSYLYNSAHTYFPKDVYTNYPKLKKNINTICSWMEDNPSYTKLISLLSKNTDMKQSKIATAASNIKYTYFAQATWTIADQFNISIGQGDNAYTPIQMCTYISALANNGVYNRASLVSGVENKGMVDKSADRRTIKLKSTTIPSVVKGMKRVTRYGTLQTVFGSYKYSVAGKTGTAENQGTPQPASEIKYLKQHLGSYNSQAGTNVTWKQVDKNIKKLMREQPSVYSSEEDAADMALRMASNYKITSKMIDAAKGSYDYYSWTETFAPADNPRIAVVTLLIQGGTSIHAAPVNKAILTKYFQLYGKNSGKTSTTTLTGKNTAD